MLVLTRKADQKIHLGPNITITILKIKGSAVRIGIEAPNEVKVWRAELVVADAAPGEQHHERPEVAGASTTQAASPLRRRVPSETPLGQASKASSRPSAGSPRRRGSSSAANASDARALEREPASAADGFSAGATADARESYATRLADRRASALHSWDSCA